MASPALPAARTYSLRGRLLWLLLIAVALAALVQSAIAYYEASSEADEIFDYHMQQIALALRGGLPLGPSHQRLEHEVEEANFDFVVQVWTLDGTLVYASTAQAQLPRQAVSGFSNVTAQGASYRVFLMLTSSQVIQVAQDLAARQELAGGLVLRMVGPVMLLAPVLMLAVWGVVTQSTRPLARARQQIARRAADELSPLTVPGLPDEVRPLVDEINLLFARLAEAFDAQRSFVADAAHELRSPLAALRLQVQSMQRATDTEARAVATRRMLAGIDRAGRLVDQMLVLARQDAAAEPTEGAPTDLRATATLAIGDVLSAARERRIDLGIVDSETLSVTGESEALRILFRNLLENAIKYAPEGGTVDVAIRTQEGRPLVEIADSGPGIPVEKRDRAFDRFYRVAGGTAAGSGLGLAIAQSIARRHHATITLDTSSRLGGLLVRVHFPASKSQPKS
ncbi:MAG TPA: ATP-binding protein [Casimicrobiaceae bacterium]|nr:ATP-binding protein [Casimicrobiaceae bacterium]